MCTVSFVPAKDGYVFTFSRDEQPGRYTANFIAHEKLPHKEIWFAKDSKAGGTWFMADSLGNVALLFNGAFTKHEKKAGYKKSRGLVLYEIITAVSMQSYFINTDLYNIEPFSVLLFEGNQLYRLTWDGVTKHKAELLNEAACIFSSATLYSESVQQERCRWLAAYLQTQPCANSHSMMVFHSSYNSGDKENGLVIERHGGCATLSISQVVVAPAALYLRHHDIKTGNVHHQKILIS